MHKIRPYRIFQAREAVRGTDMSWSHFDINPIAPRFLAVHFLQKNLIFLQTTKTLRIL